LLRQGLLIAGDVGARSFGDDHAGAGLAATTACGRAGAPITPIAVVAIDGVWTLGAGAGIAAMGDAGGVCSTLASRAAVAPQEVFRMLFLMAREPAVLAN